MTLDDVIRRVVEIQNKRFDDEVAHGLEDDLHQDVLRAIANGTCEHPKACAMAALASLEIEFARWCA